MNERKSPRVWVLVGVAMALGLGLLWILHDGPAPDVAVGPAAAALAVAPTESLVPLAPLDGTEVAGSAVTDRERALAPVANALTEAEPDPRPWVEGVVVHTGGKGRLAGIELEVLARSEPVGMGLEPESTYFVGRGRSSEDGTFSLPRSLIPPSWRGGAVPQLAILRAEAPGFWRFQAPFPPVGDEPATVLVQMTPAWILAGRIVDAGGEPIPNALARVVQPLIGSNGLPSNARESGDRRGRFRLGLMQEELVAAEQEGKPVFLDLLHPAHGKTRFEVPMAKLTEASTAPGVKDVDLGDLVLAPTGGTAPPVVAGQLVDPEGVGIRGHEMRLTGEEADSSGAHASRLVITDGNGRFRASGLGGKRVAVHSTQQTVRAALRQGNGSAGAFVASASARLVWPMHRVRVRVLDRTGAPVPGARVHLVPAGDDKRSRDAAVHALADRDGNVPDLFAAPGQEVQLMAHLPRGEVVRTTVRVPARPHLTAVELVHDAGAPGTLHLTLEPPLNLGKGGMKLGLVDRATQLSIAAGMTVRGPGRMEAKLAPGGYQVHFARVPEGYLAPEETVSIDVAPGESVELTVPFERAALLHVVALDPAALAALQNSVDVGLPKRLAGSIQEAPPSSPDAPPPLLRWDPQGVDDEGAPAKMRPLHLRAGRYGVRWRWRDGEQWIGEIHLHAGLTSRIDLVGPTPPPGVVGSGWLSLEPR